MRLLHVHSGNLYGGVETMLATIARRNGWASLEHEFALCFDGRLADELRNVGASLHWLGAAKARWPLTIIRARRTLRDVLRSHRFDAAICHMPWAQALFGPSVRECGVPLIFWMHDASTGRHWLERWARTRPPDLVLCNSHYTATSLPKLYPQRPHEVLYPPVELTQEGQDESRRRSLRDLLATPADGIVIVQASRIQPWKGQFVHLEALSRLRGVPRWVCWIVGGAQQRSDQRYLSALSGGAVELGIGDRVRFCGERTDVPDLLGAADIYCQPNTRAEPFGIAFVEALGAGLPVVTARLGGAAEIVDTSCGICVPPNDPEQLADALRRLIENPALRAQLGHAGRARAAQLCDPAARLSQLATILARFARSTTSDNEPGEATLRAGVAR
jgi:glycosyltransferase involved in cell wall biosynthesis